MASEPGKELRDVIAKRLDSGLHIADADVAALVSYYDMQTARASAAESQMRLAVEERLEAEERASAAEREGDAMSHQTPADLRALLQWADERERDMDRYDAWHRAPLVIDALRQALEHIAYEREALSTPPQPEVAGLDLEALEALCAKATPGPWTVNHHQPHIVETIERDGEWVERDHGPGPVEWWELDTPDWPMVKADVRFCAAARTALPALLARVRELEALRSAVDAKGKAGT